MATYNVIKDYEHRIKIQLKFDETINLLLSKQLIDEETYERIYSEKSDSQKWCDFLLNYILEDEERCVTFIKFLEDYHLTKDIAELITVNSNLIRDVVIRGGLPDFTPNYVVRNSVANDILKGVLGLNTKVSGKQALVIYGLPGLGKSSLTNQVLRNVAVVESTGGAIFWISLGEHQDNSNIVYPLRSLLIAASKLAASPLTPVPHDLEEIVIDLKKLFIHEKLANALIVLDDVKSSDVLDKFNIPCKLIITTQDKSVTKKRNLDWHCIHVKDGFKETESITLFKKSLQTNNLNHKQDLMVKIHEKCKGYPMLLNLVCTILRESRDEAVSSSDQIWNYIVRELEQKCHIDYGPNADNVIEMIARCVDRLSAVSKELFHSLGIFSENVNIRTDTLEKLWGLPNPKVREKMLEFEHKSLIISFFDNDLKTYIYSLHTLVFQYLKKAAKDSAKFYHKKLIDEHWESINNPQNDSSINYILGYFAYHLKESGMHDRFEKYFDLTFIENKIRHVGSNDLLNDFETYHSYIVGMDPSNEEKLNDLKLIVPGYSRHLLKSPETSIVQYAVTFTNESSYANQEAQRVALSNPDKLYFKITPYTKKRNRFSCKIVNDAVSSVCFIDDDEILVGTTSGDIETHKFIHQINSFKFIGHKDRIISLQLSQDKNHFISVSQDGTAKLWKFDQHLDPKSPRCKQQNWRDITSADRTKDCITFAMDEKEDAIVCAAFPSNTMREIVTGSKEGRVVRWSSNSGLKIKDAPKIGYPISSISYSHNNEQIICCCNDNIIIYGRKEMKRGGQIHSDANETYCQVLLTPAFCSNKNIVVMSEKYIKLWQYHERKLIETLMPNIVNTDSKITCAAVYNKYLVLGTENGAKIYIYDFILNESKELETNCKSPHAIYLTENQLTVLHFTDKSLYKYDFDTQQKEDFLIRSLNNFDCMWQGSQPIYATLNENQQLELYESNSNILTEETMENVTSLKFSKCGKFLIMGTASGNLHFYNYKNRKVTKTVATFSNKPVQQICSFEGLANLCDSTTCAGFVVTSSDDQLCVVNDRTTLMETSKLLKIFYLCGFLITLDENGTVLFRLIDKKSECKVIDKCRDLEANENVEMLAIVDEHNLSVWKGEDSFEHAAFKTELQGESRSLSFSSSGKLLGVGYVSGLVQVFNLSEGLENSCELHLHKLPVEMLTFSPNNESILMTIGDQIACWNVQTPLHLNQTRDDYWTSKKFHHNVPYLLASTIMCSKLKYISASKDFKAFLVVDSDGGVSKIDFFST